MEVDYHGSHVPDPGIEVADVIGRLDKVATGHPSAEVRGQARSLRDSIDGVVNMISGMQSQEPGVEDYDRWLSAADRLIEVIHLPSEP